ncbi:MAG: DUF2309 family protein, partial [Flavobacteriales bacterium]|nr:DUF2309 family protein [Flavobacteriales bacterium]
MPFSESHTLDELRHHLPGQAPIREFIHHNTLHGFQDLKFFEAIFKASAIFGYQPTMPLRDFRTLFQKGRIKNDVLLRVIAESKGSDSVSHWMHRLIEKNYDDHREPRIGNLRAEWQHVYRIQPDNYVHPLLFRIVCAYLDQGVSLERFPADGNGFLTSIRGIERKSWVSFFRTDEVRKLFLDGNFALTSLLHKVVGDERYFEQYLFDQQFAHPGWSGMVNAVEHRPSTLMDPRPVSLREFIELELLLELDLLVSRFGNNWKPLAAYNLPDPVDLFVPAPDNELNEVLTLWQTSFEWSYYDDVISGLFAGIEANKPDNGSPNFQALFCIDERECSLRRHLESGPLKCQTFGTPGFFGVEFYFRQAYANHYDKLCPAPVFPKYLICEEVNGKHRSGELLYTDHAHRLLGGWLTTLTLGFAAGIKLGRNLFRPKMSPAISDAFAHMHAAGKLQIEFVEGTENVDGLQLGFRVEEMAFRVENVLRSIGLIDNFARFVYLVAHGSSSANNPHHSAHDCGACSGRPGS